MKKMALCFALAATVLAVALAASTLAATTANAAYSKQLIKVCRALPPFPKNVSVTSSIEHLQAEIPAFERFAAAMKTVDGAIVLQVPSALTATAYRLHTNYTKFMIVFGQEVAAMKSGSLKRYLAVINRQLKSNLDIKLIAEFNDVGVEDCLR